MVNILGELGSKLIILGISGALPKRKKNKEKPPFCLIFFKISSASGGLVPQTPLVNSKCIYICTSMLIKDALREKYAN